MWDIDIEGLWLWDTRSISDPSDLRSTLSSKPAIGACSKNDWNVSFRCVGDHWNHWWRSWSSLGGGGGAGGTIGTPPASTTIEFRCLQMWNFWKAPMLSWSQLVVPICRENNDSNNDSKMLFQHEINTITYRLPTDHPVKTVCDTNNWWNTTNHRQCRLAEIAESCFFRRLQHSRSTEDQAGAIASTWPGDNGHPLVSIGIYVLLSAYPPPNWWISYYFAGWRQKATIAPISLCYWPCSFDSQALAEFGIKEASCNLDSTTWISKTETRWPKNAKKTRT